MPDTDPTETTNATLAHVAVRLAHLLDRADQREADGQPVDVERAQALRARCAELRRDYGLPADYDPRPKAEGRAMPWTIARAQMGNARLYREWARVQRPGKTRAGWIALAEAAERCAAQFPDPDPDGAEPKPERSAWGMAGT